MEFAPYDQRHYVTVSVTDGYGAWAETYGAPVLNEMDLPLFERLVTARRGTALDLACGTGRIGSWLRRRERAITVDGVDLTPNMLARAEAAGVYRHLHRADIRDTKLEGGGYDLVVQSLACEHLSDLVPLYEEALRVLAPDGQMVLVGYHPFFLLRGIPTHFDGTNGEPIAIEAHVHLLSDHFRAATHAGFVVAALEERIVGDDFVALKKSWQTHVGWPVTFGLRLERSRAPASAR